MGSGHVSIDEDKVVQRLQQLMNASDEIDTLLFPVEDQQARQNTTNWTAVPSAAQFAGIYQARLEGSYEALLAAREEICRLRDELETAVASMTGLDEEFQTDLENLKTQLDRVPERPVLPGGGHNEHTASLA